MIENGMLLSRDSTSTVILVCSDCDNDWEATVVTEGDTGATYVVEHELYCNECGAEGEES